MDRKSFAAFFVLGAALAIGIASDLLLKGVSWGINAPIWTAITLYALHLTLRTRDGRGIRPHLGLAVPAMLFAFMFAWRDSPTLKLLDGAALFCLLALLAARIRFEWAPWQSFTEYCGRIGAVLTAGLMGPVPAARHDVDWSRFQNDGLKRGAESVARGFAIALPVLTVFTVLLAMADSRFEKALAEAVRFDFSSGIGHVLAIGICAWIAAGVLREAAQPGPAAVHIPRFHAGIGPIEVGILLGTVNLLFATFVCLQIPYLFGGLRAANVDMSIAEYARRGFFELVIVAVLALPLLLHSHAALRNAGKGGEQAYRALAGILIALMFVVIASAAHRMILYRNEFGLTEMRFYTSAFMCWLALVFGWFVPTVLWGLRQRFMFGAFVSALVTVLVLHVMNPDAVIVRENLQRMWERKPFDASYNASLSADAVPELVSSFSKIYGEDRVTIASELHRLKGELGGDWREWSWSRLEAARALSNFDGEAMTRQSVSPVPDPRPADVSGLIRHIPFAEADRERLKVYAVPDSAFHPHPYPLKP